MSKITEPGMVIDLDADGPTVSSHSDGTLAVRSASTQLECRRARHIVEGLRGRRTLERAQGAIERSRAGIAITARGAITNGSCEPNDPTSHAQCRTRCEPQGIDDYRCHKPGSPRRPNCS
jgi:hypothetical protein